MYQRSESKSKHNNKSLCARKTACINVSICARNPENVNEPRILKKSICDSVSRLSRKSMYANVSSI